MTDTITAPTLPADVFDRHRVDDLVKVSLGYGAEGWFIDPSSVDGYALDRPGTGNTTTTADCECEEPEECERVRDAVAQLMGPTGAELIPLLTRAVVEMWDTHGADNTGMPHLVDQARPWAVLRAALVADGSPLARHVLSVVFGEA